jgi:hypothetical protein
VSRLIAGVRSCLQGLAQTAAARPPTIRRGSTVDPHAPQKLCGMDGATTEMMPDLMASSLWPGRARVGPGFGSGSGRARVGLGSGLGRVRVGLGSGRASGRVRVGLGSGSGRVWVGSGSGRAGLRVGLGSGRVGSGQGRVEFGVGWGDHLTHPPIAH